MKLSSVCRRSATRHKSLQQRCSLPLNGAPNIGSSRRPSRCPWSPDGSERPSSHRLRPRSESCRSCLRVATSRTSACVVWRCSPGWPSSSNIGRVTWLLIYTGADSAASATWQPPSSGTSTRHVLVGVTWLWMPHCGLTCGITLPWNTRRSGPSQKEQECTLNDLERDTEVVYRARIIRRQEDKLIADSKEAAMKNLPPEQGAAGAERQAGTTPRKDDMSSTSMSATLYPDWVLSRAGKHSSPDTPQLYRMPREGPGRCLSLEEELDASSVFDPLQSSQGAEGPRTPPHYSETPTTILPFDIAKVGVLPRMLPITDHENALLNVAPGSHVRRAAPPGLDRGQGG